MKYYTPEEDAIIKAHYRKLSATQISKQFLSHRTSISINRRAAVLGVTGKREGRPWTKEEVTRMKQMIEDEYTLSEIADELKRSKSSVKVKYQSYGLRMKVRRYRNKYASGLSHMWTKEQEARLINAAGTFKMKTVAQMLNKPIHSVEVKSSKMKVSFRQGVITRREAAKILDISEKALYEHLKKLRLLNDNRKINDPQVLSTIAQNILNNNRSLNRCRTSIKHLEAVARGDFEYAGVAQLVEQRICNPQVGGSMPLASSNMIAWDGV